MAHSQHVPTIKIDTPTPQTRAAPPPAYVQIKIDSDLVPERDQLRTGVSFDSVPIVIEDDEGFDSYDEMDLRGRDRSPSPGIRSRSQSPENEDSLPFPLFESRLQNVNIDSVSRAHNSNEFRSDYPTEPIITTPSFTIRAQTSDFSREFEPEDRRTLLIYITGRRHTWVSLDYTIAKLLRSGDSLVLISCVPVQHHSLEHLQKSFKRAAKNLLKYVEFLVPSTIQFELVIDIWRSNSTFDILNESIKVYLPNLLITATRPSSKFSRQQTWTTSRVSHRLVKNFPNVPILVVPALTLNQFEVNYFDQLLKDKQIESNLNLLKRKLNEIDDTYSTNPSFQSIMSKIGKSGASTPKLDSPKAITPRDTSPTGRKSPLTGNEVDDTASIVSNNSEISSTDSEDSSDDSFTHLARTISDYKTVLEKTEEDFNEEEIKDLNRDPFLQKLSQIGDLASKMTEGFKQVKGDDGTTLVRTLTGMPPITKTKSLLDDLELTNAESIKNLRRTLETPPSARNRSIKFDNTSPHELKKKPELRPIRSTPISTVKQINRSDDQLSATSTISSKTSSINNTNGSVKKRKSFFGGLFKRK